METLSILKDIALIVTCIIAVLTFTKGLYELRLQGKQKRIDLFEKYRTRLRENDTLLELTKLLEHNDVRLENISIKEKSLLIAYYEEIAILLNSGVFSKELVHYMFSYYAIRCWKSDYFWSGLNRKSAYWEVFRRFATEMTELQNDPKFLKYIKNTPKI